VKKDRNKRHRKCKKNERRNIRIEKGKLMNE
jgi:hypothetical protein